LPRRLANIKDKQYQPHPLTYLNNERRNDELDIKFKTWINVWVRQQKQFDSDFIPL
jgi:hypothetical protein